MFFVRLRKSVTLDKSADGDFREFVNAVVPFQSLHLKDQAAFEVLVNQKLSCYHGALLSKIDTNLDALHEYSRHSKYTILIYEGWS